MPQSDYAYETEVPLLIEVMDSRSAFYRLLARLLLKPLDTEEIDQLTKSDFVSQSKALKDADDNANLVEGLNDMGRGLRRQHTGTRTILATDYTMCFDGITQIEGKTASPYASVFLSKEGILYQEPRNSVYLEFLQSGVHLKSGIDLPEDHIAFELEYMAIIAERCKEALSDNRQDEAIQLIEQSCLFLEKHILSWIPQFADVALAILKTRFYQGVIKTLLGYTQFDFATLSAMKGVYCENE